MACTTMRILEILSKISNEKVQENRDRGIHFTKLRSQNTCQNPEMKKMKLQR